MASKLFHAVVGLGISMGIATAACFGSEESIPDGTLPLTPTPTDHADGTATTVTSDARVVDAPVAPIDAAHDAVTTETDAGTDASFDAPVDAPKDVVLDAFCDAAWPTTKGSNPAGTCGPVEACADAGRPPACARVVDATSSTCEPAAPFYPTWCIDGAWQCSEGSMPVLACKCWNGDPCP